MDMEAHEMPDRPPQAGARMLGEDELMVRGDIYWWWNPVTERVGWHPVPKRLWDSAAGHRKVARVVVRLVRAG